MITRSTPAHPHPSLFFQINGKEYANDKKTKCGWFLFKKVSVYAALLVHLHLCLLVVVQLIFDCSSHVQGEIQASSRLIRLTVVLKFTIGAVDRWGLAELDVVETSGSEGRIAFA